MCIQVFPFVTLVRVCMQACFNYSESHLSDNWSLIPLLGVVECPSIDQQSELSSFNTMTPSDLQLNLLNKNRDTKSRARTTNQTMQASLSIVINNKQANANLHVQYILK